MTVSIPPDTCHCNISSSQNLHYQNRRANLTDVTFHTDHKLNCRRSTVTKFVLECNSWDDNNFATSNLEILAIIFCVVVSIIAIVLYLKLRKATTYLRNATTELDTLKRQMAGQNGTIPDGTDGEIPLEEVRANSQQE